MSSAPSTPLAGSSTVSSLNPSAEPASYPQIPRTSHNLSGSVIWMSATPLPIGPEYKVGGAADDVVRMFYPENIDKNPNLQELVNVLRTVGGFQRMFACEPRAVAMR